MATFNFSDTVADTIQSAYSPIKVLGKFNYDSTITTLSAARTKYPICKFRIIPRNIYTGLLDSAEEVQIMVQPSINVPNINATELTNTSMLVYSLDVSSIVRDFLSYDLRHCSQDITPLVNRDITQSMISQNSYRRFNITATVQELDATTNTLSDVSGMTDNCDFTAVNAALLHEEENYLAIGDRLLNGSTTQVLSNQLNNLYLHRNASGYEKARQKYFTTKSTIHRTIGVDECEYITFPIFVSASSPSDVPRVRVEFYDASGSNILTTDQSQRYYLNIDESVDGEGNTGQEINQFGDLTSAEISGLAVGGHYVVQVGVGTRNIKEAMLYPTQWNNSEPLTDFSNVSYYKVYTDDGSSNQVGEDICYYIDHDRANSEGVRFHWQNRLGGIDSYTFDGTFNEGISISSKTYEQSIYPEFRGQAGSTNSDNNVFIGEVQNLHWNTNGYGALVPRVAGYSDDKYPAVRKSKVKAVREGTAISRPYGINEKDMFEDLLASPNVWMEKGWRGKEVFREDWSGYGAVSNITDNWVANEGDFTTNGSFETAKGHITGTRCFEKGDNSGNDTLYAYSRNFIKYNPRNIYEIEVRIKSEHNSDGAEYVGFVGWKADKTTKVSTSGADTFNAAHYITLSAYDQTTVDKWETFRGYVSGNSTTAAVQSNDINTAVTAYNDVAFITPMFLINHNDEEGEVLIDHIVVREFTTDIPNAKNWYSTLNRNYYVPVLIKDASFTTFDEENLQKCNLQYIESKPKRTIK